jgi:hypothetical protein
MRDATVFNRAICMGNITMFVRVILILLAATTAATAEPLPVPKVGSCPSRYPSEMNCTVAIATAKVAIYVGGGFVLAIVGGFAQKAFNFF